MYYSSGNYEAFARPKQPADVDNKHAYIIGTGLAALSAACYLVRDGQMPGANIHILEKDPVPGGACDGLDIPGLGYVMRGGREMDNHFEVMWDLFRSIPSIETEGVSVLDEYYWHNKEYDERQYRRFRCQAESLVILFYESILSGTLYDNHARTRYAKKIYGMIEELMNRDWSKMNETIK